MIKGTWFSINDRGEHLIVENKKEAEDWRIKNEIIKSRYTRRRKPIFRMV